MKKYLFIATLFTATVLFLHACVEPFAPPEITSASRFLVVDGSLNTSPGGVSQIKLSRTQNIYDEDGPQPEIRAKLTVEGDQGSRFSFVEAEQGVYQLGATTFKPTEKYRLRIKTAGNREYLSAYVPVMKTPPIDSLTYRIRGDRVGVEINVTTHDDLDKTRFYRWSYTETWEYQMPLYSALEVLNGDIVYRTENINTCWSNAFPTNIVLGSTIKLSKDIIKDQAIVYIPGSSGKLRSKYSILVKQYALTQDEYEYWNTLAKTTERTGSLFDPQPAQVTGNIQAVDDPGEQVFGYFSAANQQEQRIFINENIGPAQFCAYGDTLTKSEVLDDPAGLIMFEYYPEGSINPDYVMGPAECADCRLRGGTTQRPSFWR